MVESTAEPVDEGFNALNVLNSFKGCVRADGVTIDLWKFVEAYKELVK